MPQAYNVYNKVQDFGTISVLVFFNKKQHVAALQMMNLLIFFKNNFF